MSQDSPRIKYTVAIRRVSDGLIRVSHEECPVEYRDSQEFVWSEGNFACDCNRAAFFARAADEDTPHPVDLPCGDTAYHVEKIVWEDGVEETIDGPFVPTFPLDEECPE